MCSLNVLEVSSLAQSGVYTSCCSALDNIVTYYMTNLHKENAAVMSFRQHITSNPGTAVCSADNGGSGLFLLPRGTGDWRGDVWDWFGAPMISDLVAWNVYIHMCMSRYGAAVTANPAQHCAV